MTSNSYQDYAQGKGGENKLNILELFPVLIPINYLAVLASTVLSMIIGFLWYSKAVFGVRWVKLTSLANQLFSKKPNQLYYIDMGNHLVNLMVMGAILSVWR